MAAIAIVGQNWDGTIPIFCVCVCVCVCVCNGHSDYLYQGDASIKKCTMYPLTRWANLTDFGAFFTLYSYPALYPYWGERSTYLKEICAAEQKKKN